MRIKVSKYPLHRNGSYVQRWIIAGLYTLLIFLFLPVFPKVWNFLEVSYPLFLHVLNLLILPFLVFLLLAYQLYTKERHTFLFWYVISIIFISSIILVYVFCPYPSERFHLPEYIILAILVYRALSLCMRSIYIYVMVLAYTFLVGILDEVIQWILPNRVGEIRDIFVNWASAFFGVCFIASFTWKKFVIKERVKQYRKWIFGILLIISFVQMTFVFFSFL